MPRCAKATATRDTPSDTPLYTNGRRSSFHSALTTLASYDAQSVNALSRPHGSPIELSHERSTSGCYAYGQRSPAGTPRPHILEHRRQLLDTVCGTIRPGQTLESRLFYLARRGGLAESWTRPLNELGLQAVSRTRLAFLSADQNSSRLDKIPMCGMTNLGCFQDRGIDIRLLKAMIGRV
jgi:hypothetical protein